MTACACDYDYQATVYRKSEHTARKQHKCYECGSPIMPGERYSSFFSLFSFSPPPFLPFFLFTALLSFFFAPFPFSFFSPFNLLEDMQEEVAHYWTEAPGLLMGYLRRYKAVRAAQGWTHYRAGGWHKTPNVRAETRP